MNQYSNQETAWLRLQDLQREAENRRLIAGGRPASAMTVLRRLFAGRRGGPMPAAGADRRHEPA